MTWLTNNPVWRLGFGNPIFVRVVESAAKRSRHAAVRIAYLGALLCVTLVLVLQSLSGGDTLAGLSRRSAFMFTVISFVQLAMACLMAPVFMAGAITQEKDSQTYSVLLSTPLSNAQVVLGSLAGRLFFVLALLASGIPVFLITQLFGGVPGSSILLSFMIAAATAVFTGAVAVAIAVVRVGTGRTIFAFYLAFGLYLAAVWVLAGTSPVAVPGIATNWLTALHPFLSLMVVLKVTAAPDPMLLGQASWLGRFWLCWPHYAYVCWTLGASLLMMTAATVLVRWSHARTRVDWRRRVQSWLTGQAGTRRPRGVWNNPVAWREAATRASAGGKSLLRWLFLIGGLTAGMLLWIAYAGGWFAVATIRGLLQSMLWVELSIVLLVLCNVSASAITREREDGTLDLLLVTPITSRYYLWGKLRGLISFAAVLLAAPIGTAMMFCIQDLFKAPAMVPVGLSGRRMPLPVMSPAGVAALASTMLSFCALSVIVALNMSLKVRKTVSAVIGTVAVVGLVGLGGWACGAMSLDRVPVLGPLLGMISPYVVVAMAVAPHEVADKLLGRHAWVDLQVGMVILAALSAGAFSLVVWGVYNSMVRTFDMIVRRQSR